MTQVAEKLTTEIERIILRRINDGKLVVPTMPEAAAKAIAVTKSSDASPKQITAALSRDPVLVAGVIRAASMSAMGQPVKSVEQAVTRLGVNRLRQLLMELTVHRLFESPDLRISQTCQRLWEHSLAVALLSRDIAALSQGADPETAYLTGLLHDVGKPVVGAMLLEVERMTGSAPGKWIDADTWLEVVQRSHHTIAIALAEKWALPDSVVNTLKELGDYDMADRTAAGNFVRFANALVKREGIYAGQVDATDNDAMVMLGRTLLGVDDSIVERLIGGLRDRLRDPS